MAARENEIGRCQCPVCTSRRARLRVNVKGLAYVTCDTCNCQVFARSDRSDQLLRETYISDGQAGADEGKPAPPSDLTPVAAAAKQSWGAFPWL